MINTYLTKQIYIETPNTIGVAAKVSRLVAEQAGANIQAVWAAGDKNLGHFSLITDNNQKAMQALKQEFPNSKEQDVLVFYVPNSIGSMEEVTEQISKAGLSIDYLYTTYFENKPAIVLSTSDNQKTLSLFKH